MKGFIFILDENNKPCFININSIVTIYGTAKGEATELHLSNCSLIITHITVEETVKLIESNQ